MDVLFHNKTAAARGVAHEERLAIAHNDAAMKDIEILRVDAKKIKSPVCKDGSIRWIDGFGIHLTRIRSGRSPGTTFKTRDLESAALAGTGRRRTKPSFTLLRIQAVM